MGIVFLEHMGGMRLICCIKCKNHITNRSELITRYNFTVFTGAPEGGFLFNKVVNITYSKIQDRMYPIGRQKVRDVFCKLCDTKIGVMCEYAEDKNQRHREGRVNLDRYLVTEMKGMRETV